MPKPLSDVAREMLLEITPADTIGAFVSEVVEEEGSVTIQFESALSGYPGWKWTVSLAVLPDTDPTVLETELIPGDGALLAPDWVPWSDRLADYKAAQDAAAASESDDAEDADDSDEDDEDEDDDHSSDVLHGGDLDGVDIDDLDADSEDAADSESDESDDDDADDDSDDEDDESDEDDDDPDEGFAAER